MGFPVCAPVTWVPGGRGGCKLPSLWVMWLSLGLRPTRKGRTSWGTRKSRGCRVQSSSCVVSLTKRYLDCRQCSFGWFPSKLAGF